MRTKYKPVKCSCVCENGWLGPKCDIPCPVAKSGVCSNNGMCALQGDKAVCICNENYTGKLCGTQVCNALTKPPPAGKCKNGGVQQGNSCTCPWGYQGSLCEHSTIPKGWDIARPTSCNKKPLNSKDAPMQATWVRMQIGVPDNVQVF